MTTFNLIDEPWISVMDRSGRIRDVGIREALIDADQFRALRGDLPTQDFALIRTLLAVLYRAVEPGSTGDPTEQWEELWTADKLPADAIDTYLAQWRDRFDLLDPVRPFYQVPDLRTARNEWKSLEILVPDSDDTGALFTMRSTLTHISLAEAARWLVHTMAFDFSGIKSGAVDDDRVKGGKGYPIGVGWCGWLGGTVLEGQTLKQTLLLNLVLNRQRSARDIPLWEQEPLTSAVRADPGPFGPVQLLTWPQRRLRLHVDDGRVDGVLVCNGDPIDYTVQHLTETMSPWRYSDPQSRKAKGARFMPRALDPERSLWRGIESLLPEPSGALQKTSYGMVPASLPAANVSWLSELRSVKAIEPDFILRLRMVSVVYGAQMASYSNIVVDSLDLRAALVDPGNSPLRTAAVDAVHRADSAAKALARLAGDLATAAGGDREVPSDRARGDVYGALDVAYRTWLLELAPSSDVDQALDDWTGAVLLQVLRLADELISAASPAVWAGREHGGRIYSVGTADRAFRSTLRKELPRRVADESAERTVART